MKKVTYLLATSLVTSLPLSANLLFDLSGTPGSNIINYSASGSVTTTQDTIADPNRGSARMPIAGIWDPAFDGSLGDVLSDFPGSGNDNLLLNGGGVDFSINSVVVLNFDTIDFDPDGVDDDIELDPTATYDFPAIAAGTTLGWSGAGTLTLESGTFDSIFTVGSYSNVIDGGSYIVNVSVIPEPSTYAAIASLLGLALVIYRRRQL